MAHDPYGFQSDEPPPQGTPSPAGAHWVAGINALVWGGAGLLWCFGCTGVFVPTYEPDPGDGPLDALGVWTILMFPAWPLLGIALITLAMHGLARRWWTSVGPNLVLGGCGGVVAWAVFLFTVVLIKVGLES